MAHGLHHPLVFVSGWSCIIRRVNHDVRAMTRRVLVISYPSTRMMTRSIRDIFQYSNNGLFRNRSFQVLAPITRVLYNALQCSCAS